MRRRDLVIGVVGVAVFVVGGVVAVLLLIARVRHSSGADRTSVPITAALVAADGRHLTASATVTGCVVPKLSAEESSDSVALSFTTTPYSGPCQLIAGSSAATARAVLDNSMFGKQLMDHATGTAIRFFDGRTLRPVPSLPPGWRFVADVPTLETPDALVWKREYGSDEATMHVEQSSAPVSLHRIGPAIAMIPIDGRRVPLYYSGGAYEIWWGSGDTYLAVDVASTGRGDAAMTTAEVERIVTGLAG